MSTISALISTVNGSVLEGGANIAFPIDDIYIIQRDGIGSVITYNGNKYFTTTDIDSLTGTGLVMATALGVNGSLQPSPLKIAFPSAKSIVTKSTLLGSNSAVTFFGNIYYVSETQADILTASSTTTTPAVSTPVVVYQRKTILTDAQIKALPTTPIELVPAQGVGKLVVFNRVVIVTKFAAGQYNNIDGDSGMVIRYDGAAEETSTASYINATATNRINYLFPYTYQETFAGPWNGWNVDIGNSLVSSENKGINLIFTNALGNLTDGNAANTMEVTVFYSIVDL